MLRYLPFLLVLAVWIYAFIDCLNTPENEVRKLPKVVWVIIILLFGQVVVGPVAWFAAGRPRKNAPYGATRPDERRWVAPDDNPEFLKSINESTPSGSPGTEADLAEERNADSSADEGRTASEAEDATTAGPTADPGTGSRPDPARQEAEVRRREEESGGRDNGTDDTPPQSR
ncbi:PLD nuclease N-terminal domain-containing protein [Streptomyces albidus (ex Kaewkla and Franco 2022)]|uniref:PLD nuclease N-terminal domain-containing protein n=1 Tax=Streptomyces albidus (ex Kaewkla and Franco 2022) TaxID=722709 RepID=UPI0015EEFEBF